MASDVRVDVLAEIPLACSLSSDELRERGVENAALFACAHTVRELADGYSFAFAAGAAMAGDLLAFVQAEAACCPFFTFELAFPSPHQTIWLTVRGREGVKDIVRESVASKLIAAAGSAA
ncbi:MAG TPA: hypothetical protein VGS80_02905 [Ktedonobacterales bacterium]|jgi:hypothetical protein|nr:hypothetical protein [Ktedonobacterales bacterium]